jgi:hypothetical protein
VQTEQGGLAVIPLFDAGLLAAQDLPAAQAR